MTYIILFLHEKNNNCGKNTLVVFVKVLIELEDDKNSYSPEATILNSAIVFISRTETFCLVSQSSFLTLNVFGWFAGLDLDSCIVGTIIGHFYNGTTHLVIPFSPFLYRPCTCSAVLMSWNSNKKTKQKKRTDNRYTCFRRKVRTS